MDNQELRVLFEGLRRKTDNNSKNIEILFQYFDELIEKKERPQPWKYIGYKTPGKDKNSGVPD